MFIITHLNTPQRFCSPSNYSFHDSECFAQAYQLCWFPLHSIIMGDRRSRSRSPPAPRPRWRLDGGRSRSKGFGRVARLIQGFERGFEHVPGLSSGGADPVELLGGADPVELAYSCGELEAEDDLVSLRTQTRSAPSMSSGSSRSAAMMASGSSSFAATPSGSSSFAATPSGSSSFAGSSGETLHLGEMPPRPPPQIEIPHFHKWLLKECRLKDEEIARLKATIQQLNAAI